MAGDIFTLDADNNAAVRTVPVNAAASETNSPVIFTTDEDGNAAVRTVSVNAAASETNSPVIFTTDEDGNAAVRVVGAGGGSAPVIDELNVAPSTSAQTITAPSGTDGYSPVNVAAVTSAIDANIVAGNIKKDVEILGVTGSYEGQTPTGTMYIISNGTYNVADKAIANVNVPTIAPAHYVEKTVDANGKLVNGTNVINLNGVTDLDNYVLAYAYYATSFPANTTADLSGLTTISGNYACQNMFQNCAGITSVDLSGLTTINGNQCCSYMFSGCSSLTSINLSSLTTIGGSQPVQQMFSNTGIISVNLSSLTTLSAGYACASMFYGCSNLQSVDLSSLTTITGSTACSNWFRNCTSLTSLSFPALTSNSFGSSYKNQFTNLIQGVTGCTIHFPSNLDPAGGSTVISSLTGYPNFGGTNTVLAFDLPATES